MLKYLSQPLQMMLTIIDVCSGETLKIDLVRIGLLLLYLACIIGLCFLFMYWGIPIVSDVFSTIGAGVQSAVA